MPSDSTKVLVLCTENSCRSIMAEALVNDMGQGKYQARSAGSLTTGKVHPYALSTLQRHEIDPGQPHNKPWNGMTDTLDLIITVRDQAAGEPCQVFSGQPRKLHWNIPDQTKTSGTEVEIQAAFDQAFFQLDWSMSAGQQSPHIRGTLPDEQMEQNLGSLVILIHSTSLRTRDTEESRQAVASSTRAPILRHGLSPLRHARQE